MKKNRTFFFSLSKILLRPYHSPSHGSALYAYALHSRHFSATSTPHIRCTLHSKTPCYPPAHIHILSLQLFCNLRQEAFPSTALCLLFSFFFSISFVFKQWLCKLLICGKLDHSKRTFPLAATLCTFVHVLVGSLNTPPGKWL